MTYNVFSGTLKPCSRYQKSSYNNSVQSEGRAMLRGSRPPVAGFWNMHITPRNLKKNLDVKHWILVHFHAEMAIFYTEYLNIT